MNKILVDSNVILDILTEDKNCFSWSSKILAQYANNHELVINPIIYAEISIGFKTSTEFESVMSTDFFRRESLPYEAAFLAGKAFLNYRQKGGTRRSPLPDFYIGAHASVTKYQLLTRDAKRYQTYFPDVLLIAPDKID